MSKSDEYQTMVKEWEESGGYSQDSLIVEVSEEVYSTMRRNKISQAGLARRLKVSRAAISTMLQGQNMTLSHLADVARALGCKVEIRLVREGR